MSSQSQTSADLFVTCIVDQLFPEVGVSVVRVLRRLGVNVGFPNDQTCCGQAVYNSGFTREAKTLAKRVLRQFKDSDYVVVPSGSCSAMMRVFYQDLFEDEPALLAEAESLAARVYEFSEFLVDVLNVDDVGVASEGSAVFHPGCHLLREMEVREAPIRCWDRSRDSKSKTWKGPRLAAASAAASRSSSPTSRKGCWPTK